MVSTIYKQVLRGQSNRDSFSGRANHIDFCPRYNSKEDNKMTIHNNLTIKQCEYILDNLHLIKTLNKSQLKQLDNYAFGEEFMKSKDKCTIKVYEDK